MEKINRMADNLGVDAMWKAARDYLEKHGSFPADPGGPEEASRPQTRRGRPSRSRKAKARRADGCPSEVPAATSEAS